jgi:CRISPR-associated protein Cst1
MTGNPFVDTGQEMMAALAGTERLEKLSKEEVRSLIPRLVELYMRDGWRKNLYTIFPNSKLTNGSVKRPKEEYRELLEEWFKLVLSGESPKVPEGTPCAISGARADVYVGKMFLPMSDYGANNFQSGNSEGVPVSAAVALALQFFPLALVKVGKMMALPHFSNAEAQGRWADRMAESANWDQAVGTGGVGDVGTSKPVNAFFRLIERLVRDQTDFPRSSVTLYLFNNFNQVDYTSATEIHYMPSRVFGFMQAAMSPSTGDDWQKIVRRGYPADRKIEDEEDALRRFNNSVYWNLLHDRSISGFFVDRRKRRPIVGGDSGWRLFSNYLKEVRGMDPSRIENLRDLGDRIAPLVRDRKRRLIALEGANSRGALTDVLYRIATKDSAGRLDEPLITFDQLVTDLFPHDTEYSDWKEVKYLLLFRIYEQLFDDLKDDPEYASTADEEEETE